jgi:hypothetical protein
MGSFHYYIETGNFYLHRKMQVIELLMNPTISAFVKYEALYNLLFSAPIWDPDLDPRFMTPIWDPDLGSRFGTQIWDPNLGPQFGTPIWDPDLGPRFGTPI